MTAKVYHPYVTEKEWNTFKGRKGGSDLPKTTASWEEANAYCKWAGGRLPTDKELEGQFCPIWEWTSTLEGKYYVVRGSSLDDVGGSPRGVP